MHITGHIDNDFRAFQLKKDDRHSATRLFVAGRLVIVPFLNDVHKYYSENCGVSEEGGRSKERNELCPSGH